MKADRYMRLALKTINFQNVKNDNFLRYPIHYEPMFANMGHIQRKLGREQVAIDYFRRSLTFLPNNPFTYSSIGLVHCMNDNYLQAVESFDYVRI